MSIPTAFSQALIRSAVSWSSSVSDRTSTVNPALTPSLRTGAARSGHIQPPSFST